MTKNLRAIYQQGGVLRPLEPLDLREEQLVNVTITDEPLSETWLDNECLAACGAADDARRRRPGTRPPPTRPAFFCPWLLLLLFRLLHRTPSLTVCRMRHIRN